MGSPEHRKAMAGNMSCLLLATALIHLGEAVTQSAEEPPSRPPWQRPFMLQPVFLNTSDLEVISPVGRPAYLHCVVQNPGDKTVSWVRKRDLHILTVGRFTYTTDKRFLALHAGGTHEWTLKVLSPTLNDSGVYECQVSTEPKISLPFQLRVIVSRARILGGGELHVRSGSDVNLTCEVHPDAVSIYWYHNDRAIDHRQHDRIHIESWPSRSRLYIRHVLLSDTGNYTCGPASAEPATVAVHVINGEHPAAMQHNGGSTGRPTSRCLPPLLVLPLLLLLGLR